MYLTFKGQLYIKYIDIIFTTWVWKFAYIKD